MSIRELDFSDGFETSIAPTSTFFKSSGLEPYVDDAAFVAAKGSAAADGDAYINTTIEKIRYYSSGMWRDAADDVDVVQNASDIATLDSEAAKLADTQTFTGTNTFLQPLALEEEGTTPSNPPAGQRKLYFKNDGLLYQLNSSGVEVLVSSGGLPVGGLERQKIEIVSSVAAWRYPNRIAFDTYDNTDDGGNADVTRDFSFCNATTAAFTLNLPTVGIDTGRTHTLKKTDSTLNVVTIDGSVFSTTLNTKDEAITVYFDGSDWVLLKRDIPMAWFDASPMVVTGSITNPTKGTMAKDFRRWRREGSFARVRWEYKQTAAGTAGSGIYLYSLPTGLTIDSARISTSDANRGTTYCGNGMNNNHYFSVFCNSSTNVFLSTQTTVGGSPVMTNMGSAYGAFSNATIDNGWEILVPVVGWNE